MSQARLLGAAAALVPFAAVAVSALGGTVVDIPAIAPWAGRALVLAGLATAFLNLWLSIGRPLVHYLRTGTDAGYKHISVAPLVGTVLVVAGVVLDTGDPLVASAAAVALVLDTGGIPWSVLATWREDAFWDP